MRSTLSFPPGTGRSRIGLGADPARSQNAKRIRINTRAGRCSGAKRWSARGTPPRFSTCPFVLDAGLERWEFDPHRRGRGTGVRPDAQTRNRTGVACGENVFTFTLTVARLISGDRTATHWTQTLWQSGYPWSYYVSERATAAAATGGSPPTGDSHQSGAAEPRACAGWRWAPRRARAAAQGPSVAACAAGAPR